MVALSWLGARRTLGARFFAPWRGSHPHKTLEALGSEASARAIAGRSRFGAFTGTPVRPTGGDGKAGGANAWKEAHGALWSGARQMRGGASACSVPDRVAA